ncbi:MAG: Spy/CpxP family protein refolding chaperone [Burkholderiaceae bacterium]|nr:Spy/CpxP family protein refolding chaperone [Burkholderiaceae bacterium]
MAHSQGSSTFRRHLALTALLGTLALPVFAQPATPAPGPAAAPAADTPRAQRMRDWQERREQHFAQRAAALKEALKLTPEQEPAWQDFMNAMQHRPQHARLDMNPDEFTKLSTPERLDRMRALRTQHIAEMDQRAEAIKAFYAKLSPQQQKTFDAQFMPHQGMMGPHDKHPGRAGMRGGPGPAR